MIKTIIVSNNIEYSKNLLNNIINKIENIHITHMVTTVKETINIISNNDIDLVFLDLKLSNYDVVDLIEKIDLLNKVKKINYIIISDKLPLTSQLINDHNILSIISKSENNDNIIKKINNAIHTIKYIENEKEIQQHIISELSNIGYNLKHKGTKYIIEAIQYIYKSNNMNLLDNLEKNVYIYIAYKYQKSINNVKTNIIRATNYIQFNDSFEKYTPKLVISSILIKIA